MKVYIVNSFFSTGGPPKIVNGTHDALVQAGHSCRIGACRASILYPEDSYQIGGKYHCYINAACARIFDNDGRMSRRATRKLVEDIKAYDPDEIHLHNLHSYYINYEILFSYLKTCGKPVFWTLHDCWAFTGHCTHFTVAGCSQWKTGCSQCRHTRAFPTSYVMNRAGENYRRKKAAFTGVPNMTIVTPSHWLANLVKESFLQEYPVEVRYNQVDKNVFHPTDSDFRHKYGLQNKIIILGVALNWCRNKGFYDFIQMAEMLDDRFQPVMVGVTPQQKGELPKKIIAIERTHNAQELAAIYSAADLFVNPSREETFGLTTVEAIYCGAPVIVYENTACEEIANQYGGTVVQADPKAICQAIYEKFGK